MKKILFSLLLFFVFYNVDAIESPISCTYTRSNAVCEKDFEEYKEESEFTAIISSNSKSIILDGETVNYVNIDVAVENSTLAPPLKSGDKYYSAIDYYNQTKMCPKYFSILVDGDSVHDGYFGNEFDESKGYYTVCTFKLKEIEYDNNYEQKEELYSCNLYSSDPIFSDVVIPISINYTKKNISITGDASFTNNSVKTAMDNFKKNFDFTKKNICPINQLKVCNVENTLYWVYPKNYTETITKNCTILDSSEKLEYGDDYCKIFIDYIKANNLTTAKTFCRNVVANSTYYDNDEKSCLHMCLNMDKYVSNFNDYLDNRICGFSERLMNWVINILKWIKYILPVVVIVLGILDFIKAMSADKEDEMKKAQKRFVIRLIAAALVFIIPLILEFVLTKMGLGYNDCGLFK